MTKTPHLLLTTLLAASAPCLAQAVPLPNDGGRTLRLFDLRELQHDGDNPLLKLSPDAADAAAAMLKHFVDPPLRPGDDVTAIGNHWLAVLADEQRIASATRLFETAKKRRSDLFTLEVRMFDVTADAFDANLGDQLTKIEREGSEAPAYQTVLAADKATGFLERVTKAAEETLAAPTITFFALKEATVSVVNQTAYVKDFSVERQKGKVIANPVVSTVWDGHKSRACAAFLPDGRIGLSCEVQLQELQKPIATVETPVVEGGAPVTIQLPRTSGVRLSNVAEVTDGALVVLAAERRNGNFLVAVLKTTILEDVGEETILEGAGKKGADKK